MGSFSTSKRATETRHCMAEGSLQEGPERPLCEAVNVKPGLQ